MSDARVGGHLVSDTELDDIARDEVSQREGREPCAIVEHHGVVGLDLPQCMEHLLGVGRGWSPARCDDEVNDEDKKDDERLNEGGERKLTSLGGEHEEEEGDHCGGQEEACLTEVRQNCSSH
jgi:hypothetical protein